MTSFSFVIRAVASLIVGLIGGLIWWTLDRPQNTWRTLLAGVLTGVGAFASLGGLRMIPATPVVVTIDVPPSGTIVSGPKTTVSGTVSPPDARVLVLVHPVDSNRWWVQQVLSVVSQESKPTETRWEAMIYLGTETLGEGEAFEVIALASQDPLLLDVLTGRYYRAGAQIESVPPLSRSTLVTLYRER